MHIINDIDADAIKQHFKIFSSNFTTSMATWILYLFPTYLGGACYRSGNLYLLKNYRMNVKNEYFFVNKCLLVKLNVS